MTRPREPSSWHQIEKGERIMADQVPLTQRPQWKALERHYQQVRDVHLRTLFAQDPQRGERMAVEAVGIYLDYSKNRITDETLRLLLQLAEAAGLRQRINAMFCMLLCARRRGRSSWWTARMWCQRCMPSWTRWRISPTACAAASGGAQAASRCAISSTSALAAPTSARTCPTRR